MNQRFSITPANAATDIRLSDSVHRTLTVIGIFGDKNGWCWPSQSTLAELRNVSRQTINTHTKDLIKLGYLNIQPRYDQETGAQKSNMMQIKFDFEPDLTGGSKSKTLQGGTSPGLYTPPQAQDFTHNAPLNDLKNEVAPPPEIAIYENSFGPIASLTQSQSIQDDYKHFGNDVFREAVAAASMGGKPYRWAVGRMKGRANDSKRSNKGDAAWQAITDWLNRKTPYNELPKKYQDAIKHVGESNLKNANADWDIPRLKKQVYSYVQ